MKSRKHPTPMPHRFIELADYNTRKLKGIQHTPEYEARMAELQRDYDEWIETQDPPVL